MWIFIYYAILLIFVSIYYVCGVGHHGFLFAVIFVPFEIEIGKSPEII